MIPVVSPAAYALHRKILQPASSKTARVVAYEAKAAPTRPRHVEIRKRFAGDTNTKEMEVGEDPYVGVGNTYFIPSRFPVPLLSLAIVKFPCYRHGSFEINRGRLLAASYTTMAQAALHVL